LIRAAGLTAEEFAASLRYRKCPLDTVSALGSARRYFSAVARQTTTWMAQVLSSIVAKVTPREIRRQRFSDSSSLS